VQSHLEGTLRSLGLSVEPPYRGAVQPAEGAAIYRGL
jgi:hypothetical protein